jgi:hypothetical protein
LSYDYQECYLPIGLLAQLHSAQAGSA